jgi:hypothetical protein
MIVFLFPARRAGQEVSAFRFESDDLATSRAIRV